MGRKNREKRQTQELQKAQPVSRRKLLGWLAAGIGAAAAGGGILLYSPSENPPPETYADWYRKHLAGAKGEEFYHPYFKKPYAPTPQETAELYSRLQEVLSISAVTGVTFTQDRKFIALHVDEAVLNDYAAKETKAIAELFAYAGIPERAPKVLFKRFAPNTDLEAAVNAAVPVHLTWQNEEKITADYQAVQDGERKSIKVDRTRPQFSGETLTEFKVDPSPSGIVVRDPVPSKIFVSVGHNAVHSYTSPLAEAMHYAVKDVPLGAIRDKFIDLGNRLGAQARDGKYRPQFEKIIAEQVWADEGVVHAILDSFVEERGPALGFTAQEIVAYVDHSSVGRLKYVPRGREKLKSIGPAKFIQCYLQNPDFILQ